MNAVVESGKNPVSKHQIQPECGEWTGRRGTGRRTVSCETQFSCANGDREIFIFPCSADDEQDWQPYPVDSYSALGDGHTYSTVATLCK